MATINDPNGQFDNPAHPETSIKWPFVASAAIAAKTVVAIGTDFTVATLATDGADASGLGIAEAAIASGDTGLITVFGLAQDVLVEGTVGANAFLKVSASTDGYVAATATPAAGEVIGTSLNASASAVCDVWVNPAKVLS